MRFAAVIVTHNRLGLLKEAISRCLEEPFAHLIIVNNASDDGTGRYLEALVDKRVQVLNLNENLGGAGGFAAGLKQASNLSVDWITLFDDDAFPQKGALIAFEKHLPNIEELGAIATHVQTLTCETHPLNRPTRVPFLTLKSLIAWGKGNPRYPTKSGTIDTASFVGFFIRPETIQRHGLPDPRLFIGGDDTAYSLKLRRAGLQNYYLSEVRFTHLGATSNPSPQRAFYSARNRTLLTLDLMPWLLPFVLFRHYSRTKSRASLERRAAILRETRRGFFAGLKGFNAYRKGAPLPN